jgi:cysteine synthase A
MFKMRQDILQCVGNTSLMALRRIVPGYGSRILLKMECENPTGSMKDRMALAIVHAAEANGRLTVHSSVVEYTGGSTGVSLAMVCAVRGYPLRIVTSDAFPREKLDHMRILGAKLEIIRSENGRMTESLTRAMIEAARSISLETGSFWVDQMHNKDQLEGYYGMADEITNQTDGKIHCFVQSVGTAASLKGAGEALRRWDGRIKIVAVEPAESAVLSGGPSGAHRIDGIGAGYVVPLWSPELADRIERVSTQDALAMVQRLAKEEGIFAGTSTGANVVAAMRTAEVLSPNATIVTVMCDTGMKYLSRG